MNFNISFVAKIHRALQIVPRKFEAFLRALKLPVPKYTASAPLLTAAVNASKLPAGANISGFIISGIRFFFGREQIYLRRSGFLLCFKAVYLALIEVSFGLRLRRILKIILYLGTEIIGALLCLLALLA